MWHRVVDCLGVSVRVATNAVEVEAPLAGVLRSYADSSKTPDIRYVLDAGPPPQVWLEQDVMIRVEQPIDLIPAFERNLVSRVLMYTADIAFHAGAVVTGDGRAMVVAGESGSGKSTLVRALLARGWHYLSEECVAIGSDGTCRGLARALHVADPDLATPLGFIVDDYPLRPHPRNTFRLFHPPQSQMWRGTASTAAIVSIAHGPDASDAIQRLSTGEALAALWPAVFHRTHRDLPKLGPALAGVPLYRLHTRTPERALELAQSLLVSGEI